VIDENIGINENARAIRNLRGRLIAIFGLIDELFDPGVFFDGQRTKGVLHHAARFFAPTRAETLKPQSGISFLSAWLFGSLRKRLSGTSIFIAFIGDPLRSILRAGGIRSSA
jgi:hypothetical protein